MLNSSLLPNSATPNARPILVVDDSYDDFFLFSRALNLAGLENPVRIVPDAESAMRYLQGKGQYANRAAFPFPAVVVLDIALGRINGVELLTWIKAQPDFRSLPCVVVTGDIRESLRTQCLRLGADHVLYKPCQPETLRALAEANPEDWLRQPAGTEIAGCDWANGSAIPAESSVAV